MATRIAKQPPPVVQDWVKYLQRALKVRRLANSGAPDDRMVRLAALLALLGPPSDPELAQDFSNFTLLFFSWTRINSLDKAIAAMPTDAVGIRRVLVSVRIASQVEPMDRAKFAPDVFIQVALKLEDPQAYFDVCQKDGLKVIRAIMSHSTLQIAAQRYRGVVGDLSSKDHRDQVTTKIRTVS